jgi:alpha-L-arabinofuranosidase
MSKFTRRDFLKAAGTASAVAFLPTPFFAMDSSATKKVVVRTDAEIGTIRPELHGHFAEHLGSCIYGGLWVGPNSKIPNINGYRKQAVEYLRTLGIPVLRWPGGCFADDYHWREGIGPLNKRPKRVNINWGGYVEDNSFGTHEFIGLCRLLGAEPYLAGNVGSGSPKELRDWIEYCNFPSGSTLSDERAANGSPEPFRVKYWGIGNENWGCGGNMRPEEYARLFRDFSVYVHELGGTKPFRVACGPSGNDLHWSRGVLDGIRDDLPEGFSMHYYSGGADPSVNFTAAHMDTQLSTYAKVEQAIIQQRAVLDSYTGGRDVGLILDEWGVWDRISQEDEHKNGALWQQSTMRSAVAAGLGLNIFNRQAEKLYMCNIAQIVNVLQSLLLTDGPEGEHCIRTSTYYAFELFKPHRSNTALKVETDDSTPLGLSASASKKQDELIVSFVNPSHESDLQIDCELRGARAVSATATILHSADWNAYNSFDHPDALVPQPHPVRLQAGQLHLELPRMTVLTARVKTA